MPEKDKEEEIQLFTCLTNTFVQYEILERFESSKECQGTGSRILYTEGKTGNRQMERSQHAGMLVACSGTAEKLIGKGRMRAGR